MAEKVPTKLEIFDAVQAQAESFDELSRRVTKIEGSSEKQEARNQNITIGVLIAFLLVVVTVAVEVVLSNRLDNQNITNFLDKANQEELKNQDLQNQITNLESKNNAMQSQLDNLKTRNPYLK